MYSPSILHVIRNGSRIHVGTEFIYNYYFNSVYCARVNINNVFFDNYINYPPAAAMIRYITYTLHIPSRTTYKIYKLTSLRTHVYNNMIDDKTYARQMSAKAMEFICTWYYIFNNCITKWSRQLPDVPLYLHK